MIWLKSRIVITSGLGAELWHIAIPLALYLVLAWHWDRGIASRRALLAVTLLVVGAELEESLEKLAYGFKHMWSDVFGDIRDGLFWPLALLLTSRWIAPPAPDLGHAPGAAS